jgi:hypothetical protein
VIGCEKDHTHDEVYQNAEEAKELMQSPKSLILDGRTITLDSYVYKNLMPSIGQNEDLKPLIASVRLMGDHTILEDIEPIKIYVIHQDLIWAKVIDRIIPQATNLDSLIEAVIDNGPNWEVGISVSVVCSFNYQNNVYLLSSNLKQIEAVY